MRKLKSDLSVEGINDIISALKDYKREISTKSQKCIDKLATLGTVVAQQRYDTTEYHGGPVYVSSASTEGGATITAKGESVCFREFGTGAEANTFEGLQYGFTEGSWSETHARQYTEKGYWHYGGKTLTGEPPALAMYEARKQIIENTERVVKEVFG